MCSIGLYSNAKCTLVYLVYLKMVYIFVWIARFYSITIIELEWGSKMSNRKVSFLLIRSIFDHRNKNYTL